MKIVVDTNIVFSSILNTQSIIGDLILNSNNTFQFWSCHFLLEEMDKNWSKLRKISNLTDKDLLDVQRIIYKNITFIDEFQIPNHHRVKAYKLVKGIDINDLVFVALNEYRKSILWSGDKVLVRGLRRLGYDKIITTDEMVNLRKQLEKSD